MRSFGLTWLGLPLALSMMANAAAVNQQPLGATDISSYGSVPGKNEMHFVEHAPTEQLFRTDWLVIAPTKPKVDEIILIYLLGHVPNVDGLSEARLILSCTKDGEHDGRPREIELPLSETPGVRVRRDLRSGWNQGNVLEPGTNELLADFMFYGMFVPSGNYTIQLRARLPDPDGRLLFAFEQTIQFE